MKSLAFATAILSFAATAVCTAQSNLTAQSALPSTFKPPQVFKNTNVVHIINLEKGYPKETVNLIIENIAATPQDEYFIPFTAKQMEQIAALEVKDKKEPELGTFKVEPVAIDPESDTHFYKARLPKPLQPKAQQTLSITYALLSALSPLPASIEQTQQQYLVYTFSAYWPSAYVTMKQKTEVKFPNNMVPEYTTIPKSRTSPESPQKQGSKFTYGSFSDVPAGAAELVRVRYEMTKPLTHTSKLERDIEVSHWGGNVAFEERYALHNRAANLSKPFSRVVFAQTANQYHNPPTTAIKDMRFPLKVGSLTPYFTDVIGNVSTSRFRSNKREALLELKPRYPIFGGWNYPFRVGWDADIKNFVRKLADDRYVLNVPFLEGPQQPEGVEYEHVEVRVILPEGARNVQYQTAIPVANSSLSLHKTFMDTKGRTMLTLTAHNLIDELRGRELIVTYEYPFLASLRKPLVIAASVLTLFVAAYVLGSLDVRISGKNFAKAASVSGSATKSSK